MRVKSSNAKSRYGKYSRAIDEFLNTNADVGKVNREGAHMRTVYMGLDRAIKRSYSNKIFLSVIDGEIYIKKIIE